jgi:predicted Zn-dependent protease
MNAWTVNYFESLIAMTQEDFDEFFFRRVLAINGRSTDTLRCMAELLARRNNFAEALQCDQALAEILPHDKTLQYNLACSLTLAGQLKPAIAALTRAIELGYTDLARIASDADLDNLRNEPEFQSLLSKFIPPGS